MKLLSIHRYPVKSMGGSALAHAMVGALGIQGDRRFMLLDAEGRFVTARERPHLLLWRAAWMDETQVELIAPDGERHRPIVGDMQVDVRVWDDTFPARLADEATTKFLSERFGESLRLVFVEDPSPRAVDPKYGDPDDRVGFADGYPLLLLSDASHAELVRRVGQPLSIMRFRPNLIVSAGAPHAEDDWQQIRVGTCEFDLVKPCVRCVLTTVDPETGTPHPDREPLRTLITYRRGAKGVTFGMNLIPRVFGTLQVGDPVEVLR
ncbi:MAG: MOSC domain-containing protein [Ahniella sp.]|nr:MOSC domain-containing protein [Ahniella sp.]